MSVSAQSGVFGLHRQSNAGYTATGPYDNSDATAPVDAVQQLDLTGVDNGDKVTLTVNGFTTAQITWVSASDMSSTINTAIATADTDTGTATDVTKTGSDYFIAFSGTLGGKPVDPVIVKVYASNGTTLQSTNTSQTTVEGGAWQWLPALNVAFQPNQMVQSIPPEVGGSLWARGSYKGGVYGGGNVTLIPRGGLGLAELLYAFCGGTITSGTSASNYNSGSINKLEGDGTNGVETGAFKYKFRPESKPGSVLPWYTFVRNVGGKFVEVFPDGHLGSFSFDMAASNLLQIDSSFTSKSCKTVSKTSGGTTAAEQIGSQIAGNGLPFQMVDALVKLDSNNAGNPGPAVENVDYNPTRLNIAFNNELSQNEFVVGSFFLQDITNLTRTAQITYSLYLRDAEIYNRVYSYGAGNAAGTSDASWSSQIWKGKLNVQLTGGDIPGTTDQKYKIVIDIPEMDYQAAPISLAGNNLVEYQLTTNVVLSQDTSIYPFTIEYITDEDIRA